MIYYDKEFKIEYEAEMIPSSLAIRMNFESEDDRHKKHSVGIEDYTIFFETLIKHVKNDMLEIKKLAKAEKKTLIKIAFHRL